MDPELNYLMLRQIAECASGNRGTDLWFLVSGGDFTWQTTPPGNVAPGTVVIPVAATPDPAPLVQSAWISDQPSGPLVNLMSVTVPANPPYPGGTYPADAVFWSVSAVEKFLLPYYASVYGDEAPGVVEEVLSILRPPGGIQPDPAPYAIAHLPSSEYVEEPNANTLFGSPGGSNRAEGSAAACDAAKPRFDHIFVLRGGHAEPLTRTWRHDALRKSREAAERKGQAPPAADTHDATAPATAAAA